MCVCVDAARRKAGGLQSEELWEEAEESSSELEDEDEELRQNSGAEDEEEGEEEQEEEAEHTQDNTCDHMTVFTRVCVSERHETRPHLTPLFISSRRTQIFKFKQLN